MNKYNTNDFKVVNNSYYFESIVAMSESLNKTSDYLVDVATGDIWPYEVDRPSVTHLGLYNIDDWFFEDQHDEIFYVVSEEGNIGHTRDAGEHIDWFLTLDYEDNTDEYEIDDMIMRGM